MTDARFTTALIVGAGSGSPRARSAALAKDGIKVALAARSTDDLAPLMKETGARGLRLRREQARARSTSCSPISTARFGAPDIVIYNASFRTRGPFVDLDPADVQKALDVTAFGALPRRPAGGAAHAAERSTARSCSPARQPA